MSEKCPYCHSPVMPGSSMFYDCGVTIERRTEDDQTRVCLKRQIASLQAERDGLCVELADSLYVCDMLQNEYDAIKAERDRLGETLKEALPRMIELTRFYGRKQGTGFTQDFATTIAAMQAALAATEKK